MKVFSIKYSLTKGIEELITFERSPSGNIVYVHFAGFRGVEVLGRDCFETMSEAVEAAKAKARKKIVSLDKQRVKLLVLVKEPKIYTKKVKP